VDTQIADIMQMPTIEGWWNLNLIRKVIKKIADDKWNMGKTRSVFSTFLPSGLDIKGCEWMGIENSSQMT
jgi:hypothetical protein